MNLVPIQKKSLGFFIYWEREREREELMNYQEKELRIMSLVFKGMFRDKRINEGV